MTHQLTARNLSTLDDKHGQRPRSGSTASRQSDEESVGSNSSTSGVRTTDEQILAALDALFFEKQTSESVVARATLSRLEKHAVASQTDADTKSTHSPIPPLLAEYERTIEVVNSRLAERVMSNYNLFVQGMTKIHELGLDLHQSAVICKNGRRLVQQTKGALTTHGIIVTAKHRKRQLYASVLADLHEVQVILSNERRIREALEEGDFPRAIELCMACRESLRAYEQFTCLASFSTYVQASWELLQRRVENGVRDVVRAFDAIAYERVLIAHRRMGRGFHVLERLQRQFIETINEQTQNALYAHVLQTESNAARAEQLKQLHFKALADALADQHFVACLHTILDYLSALLITHHRMVTWHARHIAGLRDAERERALAAERVARRRAEQGDAYDDDDDADAKALAAYAAATALTSGTPNGPDGDEAFLNAVSTSLVRFRKTMWDKMQRKVAAILSTSALSSYKIDEFLVVLASLYRFIELGEAFSGAPSEHLRRSIKEQSKAYFEGLHRARMEDLSTMLAHEQWNACPLVEGFSLELLKELQLPPLPTVAPAPAPAPAATSVPTDGTTSTTSTSTATATSTTTTTTATEPAAHELAFAALVRDGNPFARDTVERLHAQQLAQQKALKAEQEHASLVTRSASASAPAAADTDVDEGSKLFITSTTINVAKFIGKYAQMMQTLEPIAFQIFLGIQQLFEFYLYVVNEFFIARVTVPLCLADEPALQPIHGELRSTLTRLSDKLAASARGSVTLAPQLSSATAARLADANGLHGAAERVVACESLRALARVVAALQPRLTALFTARGTSTKRLEEFYVKSVAGANTLCRHAYTLLSTQLMPFEALCKRIEMTDFASKSPMGSSGSSYNAYVDEFKKELKLLKVRVDALKKAGALPHSVELTLWRETVGRCMETLLEGYTRTKKCTDEGQLLRKLDLQELTTELEQVVPKELAKNLPRQRDVADYIRAYFSDSDEFLPWVKKHQENFTLRQVISIINQGFGKNMKNQLKSALIDVIREIYSLHARQSTQFDLKL